jgi:hypothetical protein
MLLLTAAIFLFFFPFKKPLVLFLGWQQMMVMGISYFSTKPELEAPFFSS